MIKLVFAVGREVFGIIIKGKEVWYSDRKWKKAIRCIPKDEVFIKKVITSRGALPSHLAELFELTEQEQKEYDGAKTEEDLANICIKDSKMKGAKLLKREDADV